MYITGKYLIQSFKSEKPDPPSEKKNYAGEKREDDAGENGARRSASVVRPERGRCQEELAPPTAIVSVEFHCCRKKLFLKGDVKKALTFAGYKKAFGTAAAKVAEQMCKGVGKGQSLAADFILMWKVENLPFQIANAHHLISS
ncbi:hypothetical protein LWI28_020415 [Acer negundo]|uniref:Uncharacterized protein n=1 Tax=Acer negundo TaxID=4023 RepID=A0AAD5J7D5_ACENE|nr:hypothetical protein LWI28_020415 [Acer negundo]